jgi:arsenate reductase
MDFDISRIMEANDALAALSALAQPLRLAAFRRLVQAGPAGLAAGELARDLAAPPSTLSAALAILRRARLLRRRRDGRRLVYAADLDGLRALLGFLVEDCCGGDPGRCRLALAQLLPAAAPGWAAPDHPVPDQAILAARPRPPPDRSAERPPMMNVLFLCTGNSARSILAEAILARAGAGRFRAFSAGSRPKGEVHPLALEILRRNGHPTAGLRSKSWEEFARPGGPAMQFVFTVCDAAAAEDCPVWPGQPMTAHWGLPDPAAATGSAAERVLAFADTYRWLGHRLAAFTALPLATIGALALRSELDRIGRSPAPARDPA